MKKIIEAWKELREFIRDPFKVLKEAFEELEEKRQIELESDPNSNRYNRDMD